MKLWPVRKRDAQTLARIAHVCAHLREGDRREVEAAWGCGVAGLAGALSWKIGRTEEFTIAGTDDGEPVALLMIEAVKRLAYPSFVATDRFPEIGLPLTRYVKRSLISRLVDVGFERAEVPALLGYEFAERWLTMLGARRVRTIENAGQSGETFTLFAWTRDDVLGKEAVRPAAA